MLAVFAMYSKSIDKIYIGQTANLDNRLRSHGAFNKGFYARFDYLALIHTEEVMTLPNAQESGNIVEHKKWFG